MPNLHLGGKLRVTVPSGMSLVSDLPTIEEWMSQGGKEAWYKPGAQMSVRKHTLSRSSPHGPSADSPSFSLHVQVPGAGSSVLPEGIASPGNALPVTLVPHSSPVGLHVVRSQRKACA